ncbi:MAG: hypothetical protein SCJ94_07775 [Bacillota bacterium]|nr:hypothetical protein [Bacillota bacterium]
MLTNLITVIIIAAVVGGAIIKLIIDKKKGVHCSGCPYSGLSNQSCNCIEPSSCEIKRSL